MSLSFLLSVFCDFLTLFLHLSHLLYFFVWLIFPLCYHVSIIVSPHFSHVVFNLPPSLPFHFPLLSFPFCVFISAFLFLFLFLSLSSWFSFPQSKKTRTAPSELTTIRSEPTYTSLNSAFWPNWMPAMYSLLLTFLYLVVSLALLFEILPPSAGRFLKNLAQGEYVTQTELLIGVNAQWANPFEFHTPSVGGFSSSHSQGCGDIKWNSLPPMPVLLPNLKGSRIMHACAVKGWGPVQIY